MERSGCCQGVGSLQRRPPEPCDYPSPSGDIAQAVRELQAEGWKVEPEDLAEVSRYLTEKITRFGEYSTHELDLAREVYEQRRTSASPGSAHRAKEHDRALPHAPAARLSSATGNDVRLLSDNSRWWNPSRTTATRA